MIYAEQPNHPRNLDEVVEESRRAAVGRASQSLGRQLKEGLLWAKESRIIFNVRNSAPPASIAAHLPLMPRH
jgi:hypothetical protein